ncbi:MAG: hypothetical protein AABZ61_10085 [Bacteroidota bacterium]
MDSISAGCVIAFAIECYENGIRTNDCQVCSLGILADSSIRDEGGANSRSH